MNRRALKTAAVAVAGTLSLLLAGCTGSQLPNPEATSLELSGSTSETAELAGDSGPQSQKSSPAPRSSDRDDRDDRDGAPCEVTGYSREGESDRREEGFSEQQVVDAVAQGCGFAERDDGHWEIDLDWIEVEIRSDGTVIEVDD